MTNVLNKKWKRHKLSHVFRRIGSGTTPSTTNEVYFAGEIMWLNTGDLNDGIVHAGKSITRNALCDHSALTVYPAGSLVIAMYGATIGKLGLLGTAACTNQACCVLAEPSSLDTKFTFYWLLSQRRDIVELARGGGQPNIGQETIRQLRVPAPRLPVQRAIADFLDRKTAAIDALIDKKEQLIELLAEKRTALINRAVTKGLDPSVPMKDSGVPWIGEIPAHWEVRRLKHISPKQTVGVVVNPSSYVEEQGEVPFVYGSDVSEGRLDVSGARRISERSNRLLSKSMLSAGDLVCVRVGEPGVTAVVPEELNGINCASIMIVRGSETFDACWLCYLMNSPIGRRNVWLVAYGAAQKQFNISHAVDFVYPVPPLAEQIAISSRLQGWTDRIDQAQVVLVAQIHRLREYRQALITAAVTGQIEVTGAPNARVDGDLARAEAVS